MTTIVCISDLHEHLVDVPACDLLLIAAGNHDQSIEAWGIPEELRCHYLQDAAIELFGLRIWGTPWQPWFYDWAFNAPRRNGEEFLASKFETIPADTDIVVAHGPPHGFGDRTSRQGGHAHVGSTR
jgi:Icc-related predicted phosphoesterase